MCRKSPFNPKVLLNLTRLEHKIVVELNSIIKKGGTKGYCIIFQQRNKEELTRHYCAMLYLIGKDILEFTEEYLKNKRGYRFSKAFRKWQKVSEIH